MTTTNFSDIVPATAIIRIDGKDVLVGPIDFDLLAALAGEWRRMVPDPMPALIPTLAGLPDELALKIYSKARADYEAAANLTPSQTLVIAGQKLDLLAVLVWMLLERSQAGKFTRDFVLRYLTWCRFESPPDYLAIVEKLYDIGGLKFLSKQLAAALAEEAAAQAEQAEKIGPSSSAGSPTRRKRAGGGSPPAKSEN
ncbi:MAG: hypothetical protein SFU86_07440 [Pirellulaceae bacterium]|nr:hypothetical protein [Pirellulaceae bacterium]